MQHQTHIVQTNTGQSQYIQLPNGQVVLTQNPQYGNQFTQNTSQGAQITTTTQPGYGQQQTTSVINTQPVPVIIHAPPGNTRYDQFPGPAGVGLGITQISIGVISIIMNIVALSASGTISVLGHGFWNGIFFIICGSFGIGAGSSKTKCTVITFLVLNILSASVFAPALLIASSLSVALISTGLTDPGNDTALAAEGMLLFLAIIAIISAAICCHRSCCCGNDGTVWPVQYATAAGSFQQPGGYTVQHPQVVMLQSPTAAGGQSGMMYVQPDSQYVQQPYIMQQPPVYTNQPPVYSDQTQARYQPAPLHSEKQQ